MMHRKVFISFLGSNNYRECRYATPDYTSEPVRYVQEAMLDMLSKTGKWTETDTAYILLTEGARRANWLDDGHKTREGETIVQPGLASCIERLHPTMTVKAIDGLPDGNNEAEMIEIFQRIYSKLQPGDELYLDITHGFRYLPMLFIALCTYAKTLLGCTLASLSYGNFEARDTATNTAQIVDLHALIALQEWALAADAFVRHGDATDLTDIANNSLRPILKEARGTNRAANNLRQFITILQDTINDLRTCRGLDIVRATHIAGLQSKLSELDEVLIAPLHPIIGHMRSVFDVYEPTPCALNGFEGAKWCIDHGLSQQAVTIVFENVVTYFCLRHSLDWTTESERDLVNKALNFSLDNIPEDKWSFREGEDTPQRRDTIHAIMRDDKLAAVLKQFGKLRDIRNDFNHSGMRNNAMRAQRLVSELQSVMSRICQELEPSVFVNISNHPSDKWSEEQRKAAQRYGAIVDIPFPAVAPDATHEAVEQTAHEIFSRLPQDMPLTVHVMGEMTLTYAIVELCKSHGIRCVASTTERIASIDAQGNKVSTFRFVEFRRY